MNGNVTHVSFNGDRITESPQLYQYDYGQVLMFDDITLPESYEVLFSNGIPEEAKVAIGTSEGVLIPDEYLLSGKNVMCWIFLHENVDDGETEYVVRIPVRPRSIFTNDSLTPVEHSIISDLIALVNQLETQVSGYEERIVALENRIPALGGWKNTEDNNTEDDGGEPDDSTSGSD